MFPFSHPSSESSHSSQSVESLSEAFLDSSSRTRDALPEQYRTQFDELRSGILAFCHEFKIPVETLRSKEAFGAELTSKRIPSERMAQAVSLFARLEHLVTNREPFKEKEMAIEYVERLYRLSEQYTSQVALLERTGILKDGAITGIDGHEYPLPTLEQIASCLLEREPDLLIKRDQGFTKLLLVPFGMSLDTLRETLKQFLLSYKQSYPDFDLDITQPLWAWEDGYKGADTGNPPKMFYHPTSFDPDNHQGQTKREILKAQANNQDSSFPGWTVHLLQPSDPTNQDSKGFALVPRQGEGQTQGEDSPRPDLEANKTPKEYLSILEEAKEDPTSPYFQESGLTPEDWILVFITHLQETGKLLDDYGSGKESITHLAGAFFPSIAGSAFVPSACWDRVDRQASLFRVDPRFRDGYIGARFSVMIQNLDT